MKAYNIDIRKNVEDLMDRFSFKALLVRDARHTRCSCYNPLYRCGDPKCKKCKGLGRFSSIECIDVIYQNIKMEDMMKMTEVGLINIDTFKIFMKCKVMPNENDILLVVGFDKNGLPVDIKQLLHLKGTREFRCDNGRVEYYEAFCQHHPQFIDREQLKLNELPIAIKQKIMKGGRYTWQS